MAELSTGDLLKAASGSIRSDSLRFQGLRGDSRRHLTRSQLRGALSALPAAPRDEGRVEMLVARGPAGERQLPREATLTQQGGMPLDRWATQNKYGPAYQLATTQADFARVIANGQPLELHGDNLYLDLELSKQNLPAGSELELGAALVEVTEQPHDGCKKWVQRFGLDAMQMNLDPKFAPLRLRGLYLRVVRDGRVCVGDRVRIVSRPA